MANWSPCLLPPWPLAELESILEDALRVLESTGVACSHGETIARMAAFGNVRQRGGRLRFGRAWTREHVLSQRHSGPRPPDDGRLAMGGCWVGLAYCDPETLTVRPASTDEAIAMARLWESRGYGGVPPVQPGDVPPRLVTLACERIGLLHSTSLGGSLTVTDPEEVRLLAAMNCAAGRQY